MISKLILILVVLVAIVALCVGCATFFGKKASRYDNVAAPYKNMGVDDFQTYVASDQVQLLDVRSQDEFDEGHIAGAVLVDVNDSTFVDNALAVLDKQRPVAV